MEEELRNKIAIEFMKSLDREIILIKWRELISKYGKFN